MRLRQPGLLVALAAAVCLSALPALAQAPPQEKPAAETELGDEAELTRAVSLYDAGKYDECATRLGKLLDPDSPRPLEDRMIVERARVYHAACLIGSGRPEAADKPLRDAIRANPQMRAPDGLVFPSALIDRFVRVRQSMLEEIRAAEAERLREVEKLRERERQRELLEQQRLAELERLASQETVVVRRQRWMASIPYGVGQFQNGDSTLGYLFLTTEALLTAAVIGGVAIELENASKLEDPSLDRGDISRNMHTARDVWVTSLYALLALAGGGILQAQLAFEPESVSTRPRALPPHLQTKPEPQSQFRILPSTDVAARSVGIDALFVF